MKRSASANWLAATVLSCAGLFAANLLAASPLAAQTAVQPPTCSSAPLSVASTNSAQQAGFICVADLDGNGQSDLLVGVVSGGNGANGYVLFFTNTGVIRKKVCWGSASVTCPTTP